jgi:hypothetical protein
LKIRKLPPPPPLRCAAAALRVGDTLQPLALADIAIAVAEILPKS